MSRGGVLGRGFIAETDGCGELFKMATVTLTPGMTLEQQQKQSSSRTVAPTGCLEDRLPIETGAVNPFVAGFSERPISPATDDSAPASRQSKGPSISLNTSSVNVKARKKTAIP